MGAQPSSNRRFNPPAKGGSATAAPAAKATTTTAAAKSTTKGPVKAAAKAQADLDLISMDAEFAEVEKEVKDFDDGKGEREVWRRVGALWKGRSRDDGSTGTAFVVVGEGDDRSSGRLLADQEGDEGVMYTLRLLEGRGKEASLVKGAKGKLATVWWPTGGFPEFTFTDEGAALSGCTHAKAFGRKAKAK